MRYVLQHDMRDCGAACLCMIASHYGLKLSIARCRDLTKTDRNGTNIFGLVDGASKIGFLCDALSGTREELMEGISQGRIIFPFIAHIALNGETFHYVVVQGISEDSVLLADPATGKKVVTEDAFFDSWTGHIVTFSRTKKLRDIYNKNNRHISLLYLIKGKFEKLCIILLLSLLISSVGILGAFVFQIVMESIFSNGGSASSSSTLVANWVMSKISMSIGTSLNAIFGSLVGLYLLQSIIAFVRGRLIATLSKELNIELFRSYYNHIIDLPISSVQARQTGDYLSRFSDISNIQEAVSGAAVTLLLDTSMAIACGVILALQNRRLFWISLGMVLIYALIVVFYRNPIEKSSRLLMDDSARIQSWLKETIDGIETIKSSNAGEQVKHHSEDSFYKYIIAVYKNAMLSFSQETLASTVELVGVVLILWAGFSMAYTGLITVGSLITFYALLSYFTTPIKNLIALQPMLQKAFVAVDRINDVLNLDLEHIGDGASVPDIQKWELSNVCFRYGNRELTLKNISLSINKGERIAIVGESGSGKTTLAKLLLRFFEPESGEILINGQNISSINSLELRQSVAYVEQDTFLFSGTIKSNLKLGNPVVTDDEIIAACQISHADKFINTLPLGYDFLLTENGANLSGGQRQRLAIARAILKKPQLLILDEATSNLDSITESGIKDAVFDLERSMSCVIIAHRLSTVRYCDRIYVMDDGRIIESGNHDDLMLKNGPYASFWKKGNHL